MPRYIKHTLNALLPIAILVLTPASSQASMWVPAQVKVMPISTNLSIAVGNEQIKCGDTSGIGKTSKESGTWTVTPEFSECGSPQVTAGSAWTVTAGNKNEVTLTIPKGEAAGVDIELSATCKIRIEAGATLGTAEDYLAGVNGLSEPSALRIEQAKVPISGTSAKCGESATTATINANFVFLNLTNENGVIEVLGSSAGPFWHHRASGEKGEGAKIEGKAAESLSGEGEQQILHGEIVGTEIEISAKSVQAKGTVYNSSLQGQEKLLLLYDEPVLVKPELKGCETKIGTNNEVRAEGHLAWPGVIFTPTPIEEGATTLPKGTLTEVGFKGSGCGVLVGKFKVGGDFSGSVIPARPGEWGTSLATTLLEPIEQYFWNGKVFVEVEPKLTFDENPATLTGMFETKTAVQEIATSEK